MKRVIVIGSGPAGYTAAIYIVRGGYDCIVIAGSSAGGQLIGTEQVENFPGFADGITGPRLMEEMRRQAERLGAGIVEKDAITVDFRNKPFKVAVTSADYDGDAVIIATGASSKWLGLESETNLKGKGVSACAICDAFLFKDKTVAVVGGGDTAIEEALSLSKFAKKVTVIHRRDKLRANKLLQDRAFKELKIKFRWNSEVIEILGKESVKGVRLKDVSTGQIFELNVQGVFIGIGHIPNTAIFKGQVDIDEKGYIITRSGTSTNVKGVFAAGDVCDFVYRQVVTAAGAGCKAALDVIKYWESEESKH